MSGLKSRNKGKRGEREVIMMLQPVVNEVYEAFNYDVPKLQRNSLQSDGGGFDIVGLEWIALEVKFCETLNIPKWWQQTLEQAGRSKEPVLIYRQNNKPWKVVMKGVLGCDESYSVSRQVVVTVAMVDFMDWFRTKLYKELENEQ